VKKEESKFPSIIFIPEEQPKKEHNTKTKHEMLLELIEKYPKLKERIK